MVRRVVGKRTGTVYRLDPAAELGRGAEGVVYRVGGRCVKVLTAGMDARLVDKVERLQVVGRKVRGFAWPDEVVLDADTGEPCGYVMRLAAGSPLEDVLNARETRSLPPLAKAIIARNLARAVAAVHALRSPAVVLSDLKPANVLLDGTAVTVVDCESVSLLGFRASTGEVVDAVSGVATPGYVPPEVLTAPSPARPHPAADAFALAAVVFAVVFGRHPAEPRPCPAAVGMDLDDAVRRGLFPRWVAHPEFDPPAYDPVDLSDELDELLRAAFLGGPARPPAARLAEALDRWVETLSPVPLWRRAWDRTRTARSALAGVRVPDRTAATVLILAAALGVAWWAAREAGNAPPPTRRTTGGSASYRPHDPPAAPKPVGPPLFRELFR